MNTHYRAECHVECACPKQSHYPFAPGVIEGPQATSPQDDGYLLEAVLILVCLGAIAAALGFALGYLPLPGWLL